MVNTRAPDHVTFVFTDDQYATPKADVVCNVPYPQFDAAARLLEVELQFWWFLLRRRLLFGSTGPSEYF